MKSRQTSPPYIKPSTPYQLLRFDLDMLEWLHSSQPNDQQANKPGFNPCILIYIINIVHSNLSFKSFQDKASNPLSQSQMNTDHVQDCNKSTSGKL